jgi:hypothetical protein
LVRQSQIRFQSGGSGKGLFIGGGGVEGGEDAVLQESCGVRSRSYCSVESEERKAVVKLVGQLPDPLLRFLRSLQGAAEVGAAMLRVGVG